jgi:hypothetical protein
MSKELQIRKGGKLIQTYWHYDEALDKGEYKERDVTTTAVQRLFDDCSLEQGVTLKDIFLLLNTDLNVFDAVLGNWCKEIVTEGLNTVHLKNEKEIDYLELYWHLATNVFDNKASLCGNAFPDLHGIGKPLTEEDIAKDHWYGYKVGDIVNWSLSATQASEVINLEIKLGTRYPIYDESDFAKDPVVFENPSFTLGHILYGIIWELSFHGGPSDKLDFKKELETAVEEINSGKAKLTDF